MRQLVKTQLELMKAVDETIPQPDRPKDKPSDACKDVFSISGRGTVVAGRVELKLLKLEKKLRS